MASLDISSDQLCKYDYFQEPFTSSLRRHMEVIVVRLEPYAQTGKGTAVYSKQIAINLELNLFVVVVMIVVDSSSQICVGSDVMLPLGRSR